MSGYKPLLDGRLVDGAGMMDVINPATETVLTSCPRASEGQLDEAVAAAKAAFPAWADGAIDDRRKRLIRLANAIYADAHNLTRILTQEQGKPLAEAAAEIASRGVMNLWRVERPV